MLPNLRIKTDDLAKRTFKGILQHKMKYNDDVIARRYDAPCKKGLRGHKRIAYSTLTCLFLSHVTPCHVLRSQYREYSLVSRDTSDYLPTPIHTHHLGGAPKVCHLPTYTSKCLSSNLKLPVKIILLELLTHIWHHAFMSQTKFNQRILTFYF